MYINECESSLHPFSAKKDELGIAGFGVSVTTMEEVFLRVRDGTAESIEHRYVHTACYCLLICILLFWHLALVVCL